MQKTSDSKRVFVLGALGAGKSTTLNIISASGLLNEGQKFVASNSISGCTQNFNYNFIPFANGEQIQLIDSPGLADPQILIDVWVQLYNDTIASKNWGIDLVIVVIEYAERPSMKEYQVFAVLNQALSAIQSENLVILFNKCPNDTDQEDAKNYYEVCCAQIKSSKFPQLTQDNFLVLNRVGKIKKQMKDNELLNAQQEVNGALQKDVCEFVFKNLHKVKNQVIANQADRRQLAESFMDSHTKKDIEEQQKIFDNNEEKFLAKIEEYKALYQEYDKKMAEQEQYNKIMLDELQKRQSEQTIAHQKDLKNNQEQSKATIASTKKRLEQEMVVFQEEFAIKMAQCCPNSLEFGVRKMTRDMLYKKPAELKLGLNLQDSTSIGNQQLRLNKLF